MSVSHWVKPATKVAFPGIAEGSTEAVLAILVAMQADVSLSFTFIQERSHAFVVRTDQGVIL